MSKIRFTKHEVEILASNKYVKNISEKAITYTNEFKKHFISEYNNGKLARDIFQDAGFDIAILGTERVKSSSNRWLKAYKESGYLGLEDTRTHNSGRPLNRELSKDEIIERQQAEIELLKCSLELLKKSDQQERQVKNNKLLPAIVFEIIDKLRNKFPNINIKHLCLIAEVSRSGYYNYIKTKNIRKFKEIEDEKIRDNILKAINFKGYKKGSRSVKMILQSQFGINYNRKRIQRIMRKYNIICPIRKANPYKRMAKATAEHRVVKNKLNRKFKQEIPKKVLLTDITYIPISSGMTYLSTIKDGSTNEILAYNLSKSLKIDIVTTTIEKLITNNIDLDKNAFIHSDQGSHYTSPKFQELLKSKKIGQSMSRRGNCWDNAPQESFFGHMKDEIEYKNCKTFDELQIMIDEYMDYYNNYRCQWNLNKLTPVQYRNQLLSA